MSARVTGLCLGFALCLMSATAYAAGDTRLVQAAMKEDTAAMRTLLQQKADVNGTWTDGSTALHWIVRADDLETVKALLQAGANVTAADRHGMTPIILAARNGNAEIMRTLIDAGADPNTKDTTGEIALMTAVRAGSVDAVKLLIDKGADVNATEPIAGQTVLMTAVRGNHPAVVKLLLDHKAAVDVATKPGQTPAMRPPGAGGGSHGVGIVRGGVPPQGARGNTPGGLTALLFAARDGRPEAARYLIEAGADLNLPNPDGITPLLMAIQNNQMPVAKLLIEKGADVNKADWWNRTPLWTAVDTRNLDVDSRTFENGITREPVLEVIELLMARGADVNARIKEYPPYRRWMMGLGTLAWVDVTGQTPFFRAARAGDVTVMKALLARGADPNIPTFNGTTPLMAAAGINWVNQETYTESPEALMDAVKLCLELGNDINAVNEMGLRAVHGAAHRGSDDILEFLFKRGAPLDVKDKEGRTPMTWAEGVFLATQSPIARPSTMALIEKLMGTASARANTTKP